MKQHLLWSTLALLTASALGAEAGPKDTVKAAARKLAEQSGYSWRTTVETPNAPGGGGRFRMGPTAGMTEKGGYTCLNLQRGDTTMEAFLRGNKLVIKTDEGWQTADEMSGGCGPGQGNPARFVARMLQNYRTPAAELEDLVGKVKDLKLSDGAYAGALTEEGARELVTFGRRGGGGGQGPSVSNARGAVKIWIKDGLPAKYEVHVEGTVAFNDREMNINRTTTTEIKNVGSTKVEVPDEAKRKLG